MPEGHTIRALANDWGEHVGERYEISAPSNRVPFVGDIDGHELVAVDTKGKHLFLGFDNRLWVHIHLGRVGKFNWHTEDEAVTPPKDSVRLRMVGQRGWVDLVGPVIAAVIQDEEVGHAKAKLGPDPLHATADPAPAKERIQKSKRAIGALLMDQTIIAGIGNIYRAELLWRSKISPYRPGTEISDEEFDQLWEDSVLLLSDGAREHKYGEPTNTVGRRLPDGSDPRPEGDAARGNHTQAYGRTGLPCARCGTDIVQAEMNARVVYWCPVCQER
jgi:endonuclease-8